MKRLAVFLSLALQAAFAGGFPDWKSLPENRWDTDSDVYPLDQEYAFGGNPRSGAPSGNEMRLTDEGASGIAASFIRPSGRSEVSYVLQVSGDLISWTDVSESPAVSPNEEGGDICVWYDVGKWMDGALRPRGFARLRVNVPGEAVSYTLPQGWITTTISGNRQTFGDNFVSEAIFSGAIDGVQADGLLVGVSSDGQNLSGLFAPDFRYYLEFTDGVAQGHRIEIQSGGVGSLGLDLPNKYNTTHQIPEGVIGSHFVIRRHRRMAEIFPPDRFTGSSSPGNSDQIQIHNGTGFDVSWLVNLTPQKVWVGAGLTRNNNAPIPPGAGIFIQNVNPAATIQLTQIGDVRYNDFIRPLSKGSSGFNVFAQGFPLNASPRSLGMDPPAGFIAAPSSGSATQIMTWVGDEIPSVNGYTTAFHLSSGKWIKFGNPLTLVTDEPFFKFSRSAFVKLMGNDILWKHKRNWDPLPWIQPVAETDPEEDSDDDGFTNAEEILANTNPQSNADFPPHLIMEQRHAGTLWQTVGPFYEDDPFIIPPPGQRDLWHSANNAPIQITVTHGTAMSLSALRDYLINSIPFPAQPSTAATRINLDRHRAFIGTQSYGENHQKANESGYGEYDNISSQATHSRIWEMRSQTSPLNRAVNSAYLMLTRAYDVSTPEVITSEVIVLHTRQGETRSEPFDFVPLGTTRNYVHTELIPIRVAQVAPLERDDEGNEIDGSNLPLRGRKLTPLVEVNPFTDRIAHRELKVNLSEHISGKKVRWRLERVPGAIPANIRGEWEDSPNHPNRFEASVAFGANGFNLQTGETTISPEGNTAIRVNVPPIGFNHVRIVIEIEGMNTPIHLLDMEVPAVVVIDPGHGGTADAGDSKANNAVANPSKTLEKTMTLDCGQLLRDRLLAIKQQQQLNLRIIMTRTADQNLTLPARANFARNSGADQLLSIHFNGFNKVTRGTETHIDSTGNYNAVQDTAMAQRVNNAAYTTLSAHDPAAINRGARSDRGLDVLSDPDLGNTSTYLPCRGVLLEVEFIDVPAVDILLNTGENHQQVRQNVMNAVADALIEDLRIQPLE